jgi:hypothetical protein
MGEFGLRYSKQTNADHGELVRALEEGRIEAIEETA